MKHLLIFIFAFIFCKPINAQDGFQIQKNKQKVIINFNLINNLILIPININGVELTFLLDTGVDETILFSLEDQQEVQFYNVEKIKLRGLGNEEPIEGLKSSHNKLSVPNMIDEDHELFVVLDQDFNFSSQIGIPVNGIIGYNFFKNHRVEIDYDRKKVVIYDESKKRSKRLKNKFSSFNISLENHKPYMVSSIDIMENKNVPVKLLVDIGNSDAVWLFNNESEKIKVPPNNFIDFLGRGLSGDIFGKRARLNNLKIGDFNLEEPIASFPDSSSVANVNFVKHRMGSIGSEILKRFTIVFDYQNNKMFLKKGKDFHLPFHYNMSGVEIQHSGLQWIQETVELNSSSGKKFIDLNEGKIKNEFRYKFILKPTFSISNVRKDSPAELCGLKKGDIVLSIDKSKSYKYTLQQINSLLKSEEGKIIEMEIERDGKLMKFKFQLKSIL
jgi:hypothetical protein